MSLVNTGFVIARLVVDVVLALIVMMVVDNLFTKCRKDTLIGDGGEVDTGNKRVRDAYRRGLLVIFGNLVDKDDICKKILSKWETGGNRTEKFTFLSIHRSTVTFGIVGNLEKRLIRKKTSNKKRRALLIASAMEEKAEGLERSMADGLEVLED